MPRLFGLLLVLGEACALFRKNPSGAVKADSIAFLQIKKLMPMPKPSF